MKAALFPEGEEEGFPGHNLLYACMTASPSSSPGLLCSQAGKSKPFPTLHGTWTSFKFHTSLLTGELRHTVGGASEACGYLSGTDFALLLEQVGEEDEREEPRKPVR